jgi:hypothetical protein
MCVEDTASTFMEDLIHRKMSEIRQEVRDEELARLLNNPSADELAQMRLSIQFHDTFDIFRQMVSEDDEVDCPQKYHLYPSDLDIAHIMKEGYPDDPRLDKPTQKEARPTTSLRRSPRFTVSLVEYSSNV